MSASASNRARDTVVTVELGDRVVEARVRRSRQARTTRIRVGRDLPLEIVVPAGASDQFAAEALRAKADWLRTKLGRIERARARDSSLGIDAPGTVWLLGQSVPLSPGPVRFAQQRNGALIVPDDPRLADAAVRRWYRRVARRELRRVLAEEQDRLAVEATGFAVRDQRTRWGSCSPAGRVSLNWRLVVAPEDVARYVAIHELCHLRVANHSRAFWRMLGQACPEWRDASAWLGRHGDELRHFDAGSVVRQRPG
jgi:predicted metal-dependent hydrolase